MKVPAKFKEYIWLVNTIRKYRRISYENINRLWVQTEMSEGKMIPRTTFMRHIAAIEDIFGIDIECDVRDGYKYYIDNAEVLREDTVQNWMISTMGVSNILSESLSLQDRILLEPVSSDDCLQMVIDAMKRKVRITVKYRRYGSDEPREFDMEPYCVKLFRQRWYVLGHFHHDATEEREERDYFGMFSFDRILDMQLTDVKFEVAPDFDAQQYFSECYGVMVDDAIDVTRIVIRAFGIERYYMRDLPMHSSQREIAQGEDYADFELCLRPTMDFKGHILNRASQVKVIEPQWLADDIKEMIGKMMERYK